MAKKRKPKIEFRYYKMPAGSPVLALLGQKWIQNYGRDIDYLHFHNFLEVGYCYEGKGEMLYGETMHRFEGGEFTVIPKNYPHTTNSDPGNVSHWEYLFIDVEGFLRECDMVNPARAEKMIQRINSKAHFLMAKDCPQLYLKISGIFETMRQTEEFYMEEMKGILMAFLAALARENREDEEEREEGEGKLTLVIAKAVDYISDHYREQLKVEDLAKLCHISETHFRRVFSTYMHMSPLEYMNLVRIQTACEHLKKTDAPIADIAHKSGFLTLSTFNRNFRQVMGISPHEWRKKPENYEQQLLKYEIHSEEGW